ncbi:hypothetical protein BKA81DRAFT_76588 [Phyllosticta paracitricarpa]
MLEVLCAWQRVGEEHIKRTLRSINLSMCGCWVLGWVSTPWWCRALLRAVQALRGGRKVQHHDAAWSLALGVGDGRCAKNATPWPWCDGATCWQEGRLQCKSLGGAPAAGQTPWPASRCVLLCHNEAQHGKSSTTEVSAVTSSRWSSSGAGVAPAVSSCDDSPPAPTSTRFFCVGGGTSGPLLYNLQKQIQS